MKEKGLLEFISMIDSRKAKFKCKCWNTCIKDIYSVNYWTTKSCWCSKASKTHWLSSSRIYHIRIWINDRCYNDNNPAYKHYWWRWIKCLWRWFQSFYNDMISTYQKWLTIERINNDWDYCVDNCRWATHKEQENNRRDNIIYNWVPLSVYCREYWLNYKKAYRYYKNWNLNTLIEGNYSKM